MGKVEKIIFPYSGCQILLIIISTTDLKKVTSTVRMIYKRKCFIYSLNVCCSDNEMNDTKVEGDQNCLLISN